MPAEIRSYQEEYEPERRPASPLAYVTQGLMAAAVAAGGVYAHRRGWLRPLWERAIRGVSRIQPGRIASFRRLLNQQAEGQFLPSWEQVRTAWQQAGPSVRQGPLFDQPLRITEMLRARQAVPQQILRSQQPQSGQTAAWAEAKLREEILNAHEFNVKAEEDLLRRTGFRHAKVEDLAARGLIDVNDSLWQEALQNLPGLYQKVADYGVLISEAGEIADVRGARRVLQEELNSLEQGYGLPFVGFNPLQLFYPSQWLRWGDEPWARLFGPKEIQPALSGDQSLGHFILYAAGKAYDLSSAEPTLLGEGSLIPTRGPLARFLRSLAGVEIAAEEPLAPDASAIESFLRKVGEFLDLGRTDIITPKARLLRPDTWFGGLFTEGLRRVGLAPRMVSKSLASVFGEQVEGGPVEWLFMPRSRSFYASRQNIRHVSKGSLMAYGLLERLNESLGQVGLGLSRQYTGSAGDLAWGLFSRRVLPVVGGIYGLMWMNQKAEDLGLPEPEDVVMQTYVDLETDLAAIRQLIGLTDLAREWSPVFPGGDQLAELPVIGPLLLRPSETPEDVRERELGLSPVRTNRFWPFSNEPFTGERIDRFEPSTYRKVLKDTYGPYLVYPSERAFWEHGPVNPIRYLAEPYWLEEQIFAERPYPRTGPIPEIEEIPFVGPLLWQLVGRFLKPEKWLIDEEALKQAAAQAAGGPGASPEAASTGGAVRASNAAGLGAEAAVAGAFPTEGARQETSPPLTVAYVTASGGVQLMHLAPEEQLTSAREALAEGTSPRLVLEPLRAPATPEPEPGAGVVISEYERAAEYLTNIAGFYGFAGKSLVAPEQRIRRPEIARSSEMTSYGRWFWNLDIGGLGGEANELLRRFLPPKPQPRNWNPIPNDQPAWMPGEDYMIDFHRGDPYMRVGLGGEYRVPGRVYEKLYDLPEIQALLAHPATRAKIESGEWSLKELYSPISRLRILALSAPWSEEYRELSAQLSQVKLSPEEEEEVRKIQEMAKRRKKPLRVYDYRFRDADVISVPVTVTKVIDANTFLTEEYPEHPVRLAGVRVSTAQTKEAEPGQEFVARYIQPGTRLRLYINKDERTRFKDDTYSTLPAVVFAGDRNINLTLIQAGLGKEDEDDFSPVAVHARFTPAQIAVGTLWERIAHLDTPINTKFLQVRSPVEQYERREIYGKDFQDWANPISDFLLPTYESFIHRPPVWGVLAGATLGMLFGRRPFERLAGAAIGGGLVAVGSALRWAHDKTSEEAWVPPRRKQEWEIEEYMDRLAYLRAARQFVYWSQVAKEKERFDVQSFLAKYEEEGRRRQQEMEQLLDYKRRLYRGEALPPAARIGGRWAPRDTKAARQLIQERLHEISSYRELVPLGPASTQALLAYQQMGQTVYGWRGGSLRDLLVALPKRERTYLPYMLKAPPRERERILQEAPPYLREALKYMWEGKLEPPEDLLFYFTRHGLPGPDWAGWNPQVPLNAVKVKIVQRAKQDPSEFDIWPDDEQLAENVAIPVPKLHAPPKSPAEVRRRLLELLGEAGVEDLDVIVEPKSGGTRVHAEFAHDRREELEDWVESHPELL